MTKKLTKPLILLLWIGTLLLIFRHFLKSDVSLDTIQTSIRNFIRQGSVMAPLLYIVFYIIRPLLLFPATLLTTISGLLFGPVWGMVYTIIGENLSANLVFLIGRYFGHNIMEELVEKKRIIPFLDRQIYQNQFFSILLMRLLFMPFDLVGFMAGFRKLRQLDFALGTFFGILPGLTTFVLLGSSIADPKNLALTGVALTVGLFISIYLKRKTFTGQVNSDFQPTKM